MRIVTLATFPTSAQAELARGHLLGEGIEARLDDDLTGTVLGGYITPAVGGVKILVREGDVARARDILDALRAEPWVGQVFGGEAEDWRCPACGVEVDGNLDVCWACGTSPEGVPDPDFEGPEGAGAGAEREEEPQSVNERDAVAGRALRYAIFGTILVPPILHLVSLVVLLRLVDVPGKLSPRGRRHVLLALILDTLMLGASVLLFRAIVGSPRHGIG